MGIRPARPRAASWPIHANGCGSEGPRRHSLGARKGGPDRPRRQPDLLRTDGENDVRVGMHDDVHAQGPGHRKLDELLEQPSPDRAATGLKPDVRAETELQGVDAAQRDGKPCSCHNARPVALEGTKQREIAAIDDDPVLERRRARLEASIEQRTTLAVEPVAGRDECDRCGQRWFLRRLRKWLRAVAV